MTQVMQECRWYVSPASMIWLGSAGVRPDAAMGYEACEDAKANHPRSGNTGAGCGATVGKLCGMERASKSGLGIYAVRLADWRWQQ